MVDRRLFITTLLKSKLLTAPLNRRLRLRIVDEIFVDGNPSEIMLLWMCVACPEQSQVDIPNAGLTVIFRETEAPFVWAWIMNGTLERVVGVGRSAELKDANRLRGNVNWKSKTLEFGHYKMIRTPLAVKLSNPQPECLSTSDLVYRLASTVQSLCTKGSAWRVCASCSYFSLHWLSLMTTLASTTMTLKWKFYSKSFRLFLVHEHLHDVQVSPSDVESIAFSSNDSVSDFGSSTTITCWIWTGGITSITGGWIWLKSISHFSGSIAVLVVSAAFVCKTFAKVERDWLQKLFAGG